MVCIIIMFVRVSPAGAYPLFTAAFTSLLFILFFQLFFILQFFLFLLKNDRSCDILLLMDVEFVNDIDFSQISYFRESLL